jgi:hypothetical protein
MDEDDEPAANTLLPCPFCGFDKPRLRSNGIGDFYILRDSEDDAVYSCGATSSDNLSGGATIAEVNFPSTA